MGVKIIVSKIVLNGLMSLDIYIYVIVKSQKKYRKYFSKDWTITCSSLMKKIYETNKRKVICAKKQIEQQNWTRGAAVKNCCKVTAIFH